MGIFGIFKNKHSSNIRNDITVSNDYESKYIITKMLSGAKSGFVLTTDPKGYARWFNYDLGINDPYSKYLELIQQGYLIKGDVSVVLNKMKMPELKTILDAQKLPTKGKKQDLIDRIISECDLSTVELPEYYVLSDLGNRFYSENVELLEIRKLKEYDISFEQFYQFKSQFTTDTPNYVVILKIMAQKYPISNISPVLQTNERLENGELPWGWTTRNATFTQPISDTQSYYLHQWIFSPDNTKEKYYALKSYITFLNDSKKLCEANGECAAKWFTDIIANDEYFEWRNKELEDLKRFV